MRTPVLLARARVQVEAGSAGSVNGSFGFLAPVALIYLDGTHAQPSAAVLTSQSNVQDFEVRINPGESRISRAAVIATGVRTCVHGVDSAEVLDTKPLRVRPRGPMDNEVPWVWDVVHEAGLRAAVIGWPGISVSQGSRVPMVSEHALAWGEPTSDRWPLAGLFVEPAHLRESVARSRVAPSSFRPDELPSMSGVGSSEADRDEVSNAVRAAVCRARNALGALEVLVEGGVDFVAIALHVPRTDDDDSVLGTFLLDLVVSRVREILDPESTILTIATVDHLGRCVLSGPRLLDGAPTGMRAIDIAPSVLGLLRLERPTHVEGSDLTKSAGDALGEFVIPTALPAEASSLEVLVEGIEADGLVEVPERRRQGMRRFAVRSLLRKWSDARLRRDFKTARSCAGMLVRLDSNVNNLWRLAFSCSCCGDGEGVQAASSRLLQEYPGSPEAMLSGVLTSPGAPSDQLRAIVEVIDPTTLVSPSMRATWARSAIKAGMVDQGIDMLEKLVDSGLGLAVDRLALVRALHARGDSERACAVLGPLGGTHEAPLNMRLLRARVLLQVGRVDEARAIASAVLEEYPHERRATAILSRTDIDRREG